MSKELIHKVKEKVNIFDLANRLGLSVNNRNKAKCYNTQLHNNGDMHPSLSLNKNRNRFKCFGCGESGSVIDLFMGCKGVDLNKAVNELAEMYGITNTTTKPKVVARYEYKSKEGKTLYIKERVEPGRDGKDKEFFFKHQENGKLVNGRGCEPVLYNLQEVIKAEVVFFVEGEGKVEMLRKWGIIATCLDAGANSKWKEEYNKYIEDKKEINFLPDNDKPGRAYASTIANAVHDKVDVMKIIALPGQQEKGDIIDWAQLPGNDKEKLLGIIESTPIFNGEAKEDSSKLIKNTQIIEVEDAKQESCESSTFNAGDITSLLIFACLGDKKNRFFSKITGCSDKIDDFVKEYAINSQDHVPKRNYETKPNGKTVCHYEPLTEAKIFMSGLHLILYAEQLYLYRNGWYQPFNERFFLKLIEHQIHIPFKAHRSKAKEILEMVKDNLYVEELHVNTRPNLINIKNGLLNIDTFKLIPHTPEEKFIYQINAHYDPQAKCKRFEAFLQEILVTEDKLTPDKELIRLVQQFMGYILYLRIPFHKCLMLYGKGRNGKSVLVFVILELLKGLCSHVHFESIGVDMFATSDLAGKLLNVSSELSATAKLKDGDIKKIIGGDELRAQRKFQPAFNFRTLAKHIICTNNLPQSRDKSLGFFSKFTIVPFHKTYLSKGDYDVIEDEETKRMCAVEDEFLEDKLKEELDGILLWSLFGLKDLLANKGFCVPTQVQKLKKVFELRSTSVESFFEERVDDSDSTENTPSPTLYQAYIRYCKEYKIPPETNRGFLTSVKNLGYEIRPGSKNVNFVQGVCLKEEG